MFYIVLWYVVLPAMVLLFRLFVSFWTDQPLTNPEDYTGTTDGDAEIRPPAFCPTFAGRPVEQSCKGDGFGVLTSIFLVGAFSRMRSEGSRFIWGSGGEAVFAESCVYVGNRPQPFATVCVSAISSPQWRVRQEWSWKRVELSHGRRSYIGVCRGGFCVSDLCGRSYFSICSGGVCVSDLCRRRYIGICSGGVCVSDLWRRSYIGVWRGVVSVIDLFRRSYIVVCRGGVCVSDLCRRSYFGICSGGVCVSDLCRRTYIGVWRGVVSVIDLCRRSYIGVYRGGVGVSELCRRSYIGVCRGGVGVTDLCRRSFIGVCRGGVSVSDLCRRSYIGILQRRCLCERSVSPQFAGYSDTSDGFEFVLLVQSGFVIALVLALQRRVQTHSNTTHSHNLWVMSIILAEIYYPCESSCEVQTMNSSRSSERSRNQSSSDPGGRVPGLGRALYRILAAWSLESDMASRDCSRQWRALARARAAWEDAACALWLQRRCFAWGLCVRDLCPCSYIGVCRGGVCVSDLCRCGYIGVCRGSVSVSDLCQVRVSYKSVK